MFQQNKKNSSHSISEYSEIISSYFSWRPSPLKHGFTPSWLPTEPTSLSFPSPNSNPAIFSTPRQHRKRRNQKSRFKCDPQNQLGASSLYFQSDDPKKNGSNSFSTLLCVRYGSWGLVLFGFITSKFSGEIFFASGSNCSSQEFTSFWRHFNGEFVIFKDYSRPKN